MANEGHVWRANCAENHTGIGVTMLGVVQALEYRVQCTGQARSAAYALALKPLLPRVSHTLSKMLFSDLAVSKWQIESLQSW